MAKVPLTFCSWHKDKKLMNFLLQFSLHTWMLNQFPLFAYILPYYFFVCCDFWVKIICSLSWLESSKFCQFLWDFFFVLASDLLADGYLLLVAWQVCWSIWVKLSEYPRNIQKICQNLWFLSSLGDWKTAANIHNEDLC